MYELQLERAYKKVVERNRVRRETGILALDTRSETFSAFSIAVVTQWEHECDRYKGIREAIAALVINDLGNVHPQRIHLVTRNLFYVELEYRFGLMIPLSKRLQVIFDKWWEARHAAV